MMIENEWDPHISYPDTMITGNATLLRTIKLWDTDYVFSPTIQKYRESILKVSTVTDIELLLPQIVSSMQIHRGYCPRDTLLAKCTTSSMYISLFWTALTEFERNIDPVYQTFTTKLLAITKANKARGQFDVLQKQGELVELLIRISATVREIRVGVSRKRQYLQQMLREHDWHLQIPLPVISKLLVSDVVVDECHVFDSQFNPLLMTFCTTEKSKVKVLFKSGNDLRQDRLIQQTVNIMDMILKEHGLFMHIVTYDVCSTGLQHGFIEFVESRSLESVLSSEHQLASVLRDPISGNIDTEKMERFILSTAAYTVMTYILCIGDRHLDNIMLTPDGRLFHIDFGFVGREPKPFAPEIRLCSEILEALGGKQSDHYMTFMHRCVQCFMTLRKNYTLFIDPLHLMTEAGLADISPKYLTMIQKRLLLQDTDPQAYTQLMRLVDRSFDLLLPRLMDAFHSTWKVFTK